MKNYPPSLPFLSIHSGRKKREYYVYLVVARNNNQLPLNIFSNDQEMNE